MIKDKNQTMFYNGTKQVLWSASQYQFISDMSPELCQSAGNEKLHLSSFLPVKRKEKLQELFIGETNR